jgi:hypothetical protein
MQSNSEAPATPLFRNEALKFQAARLQGEVLLKIRSPWLVVGFACVALAVLVVAAAALVTYDRKERASGSLVSSADTLRLNGAGQDSIELLPAHRYVEAQLRIAPAAIVFIRRGQSVQLRYDAFPNRTFGLGQGKIVSVSLLPAADGFYRAQVVLERDYVQAFGERIALRPGMSFTGDVVIERRSMLEWLFEPLKSLGARS